MTMTNLEQLEAELINCPHTVSLHLKARPAFVFTSLIQDALVRGSVGPTDAASFVAWARAFEPMFNDCPQAQAVIALGWEEVKAAEAARR